MASTLSETDMGAAWLGRFEDNERDFAAALIDEVMLVSRDDFWLAMSALIDKIHSEQDEPRRKVALFAERRVKKVFGKVPAFFPGSRHGRATGPGVPPIVVDPRDQEVGSEGIIAQLITDYCRLNPDRALPHPGPDAMRSEKVGRIVVVTDLIGSGQRVERMLESFRYVRTLRSWRSYGWIRFAVVTYCGTLQGLRNVQRHKLKPILRSHIGCPTLDTSFRGILLASIEQLCRKYPEGHPDPLGYGKVGALIAFAHGCPNNVPPLLHSRAADWVPLFPGRSTTTASDAFSSLDNETILAQRAEALLNIKRARSDLLSVVNHRWIASMLVMEAAQAGLRSADEISASVPTLN